MAYFSFLCLSVCVALRLRSLLFPPPVYVASAVFLVKPTFSLNAWSHGPQQQESRASVPTILHTIPDEPQRSIVERVTHCLAAHLFATILPGLHLFGARDGVYCGRIPRDALLESARDRVCILLSVSESSASHTLSGDAAWGGSLNHSPPFCFFWHQRERDRVFILRG